LGTTRDQQMNKRIQTLWSTRMSGSASEQKDSHTHWYYQESTSEQKYSDTLEHPNA
jgi:hypothetical protein